jgi:phage gpG-like protein
MSDGIRIEADTAAALAELQRMEQRGEALAPLLSLIGEDIIERVKGRFAAGKGPDGQAWAANSPVTLAREALRLAVSKGNRNKGGGGLNARGQRMLAGKRPLIGEGKTLSGEANNWDVAGNGLDIYNTQIYAAIQQFGGTRGQFPHLWGDIPARPFMPVTSAGDLYPAESDAIVAAINDYILDR